MFHVYLLYEKTIINGITTKTFYNNYICRYRKIKNAGTSADRSVIVQKG